MRVITLIFLLLSIVSLGCQRQPAKNELGPQVSDKAIQALQSAYLGKLDPYKVKAGEKVHMAQTQEIFSSQAPYKTASKEWTTEVIEVENFEDRREITTVKTEVDKILDPNFVYQFKNLFQLPQIQATQLLKSMDQDQNVADVLISSIAKQVSTEEVEVEGIAFHNLQTRIVSMIPPKKVIESENCGGIPDCRIKADVITYDVVFLMSNGETQKSEFEWYASSEVPFFASILKQCASTLVPIENVRVYVKQCSEVVDFTH